MLIASAGAARRRRRTLAPSTLSLIRNMFLDPASGRTAIGIWITSYSVGAAIGPLRRRRRAGDTSGGARSSCIGVPVMVLLLIVGPMLLPEYRDPAAGGSIALSAALSLAGRAAVIFGLKRIAQDGLGRRPRCCSSWPAWPSARAFVRRQLRLAGSADRSALFRMPALQRGAGDVQPVGILSSVRRLSLRPAVPAAGPRPLAAAAALWTVPWALGFVVGSMLAPVLVRRIRPRS